MEDVRFALRLIAHRPGVTCLVVATLAVGIAASTTLFTVADAILWHPLPFRDPARLVSLRTYRPEDKSTTRGINQAALDSWSAKAQIFEQIHIYDLRGVLLTIDGEMTSVTASAVSKGAFALLGVRPRIGRDFSDADYGGDAASVVVLSDALWRSRFNAAPDVVGRTITVGERPSTIVGVTPPAFAFPVDSVRLWQPLVKRTPSLQTQAIARLRRDVTITQAQSLTELTSKGLQAADGRAVEFRVVPVVTQESRTVAALYALAAAVGLLLLIAVSNSANVLLAEAIRRDGEMVVRRSLGASAWRLARQLITESLVVSAIAGGIALLVATWALKLVAANLPWRMTFQTLRPFSIDWRGFAFAIGITVAAGVAAAVAPLVRSRGAAARASLKSATIAGSGTRLRSALLVTQMAFTLVLLAGAGLLANGFVRLARTDLGFDSSGLIAVGFQLPSRHLQGQASHDFLNELRRRAENIPGVTAATISESIPPHLGFHFGAIETADRGIVTGAEVTVADATVDDGFFSTLRIPLQQGRLFGPQDDETQPPVSVVSAALANRLWPDGTAIGRRFRLEKNQPWQTVVGMVGDVANGGFDAPLGTLAAYTPRTQTNEPWNFQSLIVRTPMKATAVERPLRELIRGLNANVPVFEAETADALIAASNARVRFATFMMAVFAAIAVMLSLVGVYGTFSCAVRNRTREIGVRLAIGAEPRDIVGMMLKSSGRLVAIALVVGVPLALVATRSLKAILYEVSPSDPATFAAVTAAIVAAALLASYLPARSGSRIDPAIALRHD